MKHTSGSSLRCALVFDLDGVIIDTRAAVTAAYLEAGVTMPADAWGRPWRTWCDVETHKRKNLAYPAALQAHSRPGPLFNAVKLLRREAYVLTGASPDAVNIIRRVYDIDFSVLGCEQSRDQKIDKLNGLAAAQLQVVYFDDDRNTVFRVNEVCHANVHAVWVARGDH